MSAAQSAALMRAISLAALLVGAAAHPLCLTYDAPYEDTNQLSFCTHTRGNQDGTCCTVADETAIKAKFDAAVAAAPDPAAVTPECRAFYAQTFCGSCEPFAAHLYPDPKQQDAPLMCTGFCNGFLASCGASLGLAADWCDSRISSGTGGGYCYPYTPPTTDTVVSTMKPYFPNMIGGLPELMTGLQLRPDANAWWILAQQGVIYEIMNDPAANGLILILDIEGVTQLGAETGLLGLAFRPDFATSRVFYINYIKAKNTVIAEYTFVPGNPGATAATGKELLQFARPNPNHNGGALLFSPGQMALSTGRNSYDLYITSGDGGGVIQEQMVAQDLNSLLGKILRIRVFVDRPGVYESPDDNPFAQQEGTRKEIWAYGMRNPWRCTFDRISLEEPIMYCGDVGQDASEKITRISAGDNGGWPYLEGDLCVAEAGSRCDMPHKVPEFTYCHGNILAKECAVKPFYGRSVTGGYIYRGRALAEELYGAFIMADFDPGLLGVVRINDDGVYYGEQLLSFSQGMLPVSTFAEDALGEIFMAKYGGPGMIYQLPCGPACTDPVEGPVGEPVLPAPTGSIAIPALTFKAGVVVEPVIDNMGLLLDAEGEVYNCDNGDSLVLTLDVAVTAWYTVAYTINGAPPNKQPLTIGLLKGRVTCSAAPGSAGLEGLLDIPDFNTGGFADDQLVSFRASDILLAKGPKQTYTLCFEAAAWLHVESLCIDEACVYTVDTRTEIQKNVVHDPILEELEPVLPQENPIIVSPVEREEGGSKGGNNDGHTTTPPVGTAAPTTMPVQAADSALRGAVQEESSARVTAATAFTAAVTVAVLAVLAM